MSSASTAVATQSSPREPERAQRAEQFVTASNFYPEAATLRAQFEWRVAITRSRDANIFTETTGPGLHRFFNASADRVFGQAAVTNFLSHLRFWAREAIGSKHASSPQIQVFSRGCWREPALDATPADWRYIYVLGPKMEFPGPRMTLVPPSQVRPRSLFSFSRTTRVELRFNSLLVYRAESGCGIEKVRIPSDSPIAAAVLLVGYVW